MSGLVDSAAASKLSPSPPPPAPPPPDFCIICTIRASTGRGVQLLEAMADEWGWTATSTGKLVWFRVLTDNGWALDRELEGQAGL